MTMKNIEECIVNMVLNETQSLLNEEGVIMSALKDMLNSANNGDDGDSTEIDNNVSSRQRWPNFYNKLMGKSRNSNVLQTGGAYSENEVQAVANCIKWSAGMMNAQPPKDLNPEYIVQCCHAAHFDIPLLLAQAHYETHFGTDPKANRAKATNSIFSIGCYDNGENKVTYPTLNDSVKGYINLMSRDYLFNGKKSVNDLLSPKQNDENATRRDGKPRYLANSGMVNAFGAPYSTAPNYETTLSNIRNGIISRFFNTQNDKSKV